MNQTPDERPLRVVGVSGSISLPSKTTVLVQKILDRIGRRRPIDPQLFKHLFYFIGQYSLTGTPVLLAATGGSERRCLTIEHQLRPLFGFFQALPLPIGVFASDDDFHDYRVSGLAVSERIDTAISCGMPLINPRTLTPPRPVEC